MLWRRRADRTGSGAHTHRAGRPTFLLTWADGRCHMSVVIRARPAGQAHRAGLPELAEACLGAAASARRATNPFFVPHGVPPLASARRELNPRTAGRAMSNMSGLLLRRWRDGRPRGGRLRRRLRSVAAISRLRVTSLACDRSNFAMWGGEL